MQSNISHNKHNTSLTWKECVSLGVFGIIGLSVLALSVNLFNETLSLLRVAKYTEGTVVDFSTSRNSEGRTMYAPVVSFTSASGEVVKFTSNTSSSRRGYDNGEKLEVIYDPANTQDARINSFFPMWGGALISLVLGVVFSGIGVGTLVYSIKQKKLREWLALNGQTITARVTDTTSSVTKRRGPTRRTQGMVHVSRRETARYYINAQWQNPRDQKLYLFKSDGLGFDPAEFLKETISVRIDPANPKRYMMDLSFLPEVA